MFITILHTHSPRPLSSSGPTLLPNHWTVYFSRHIQIQSLYLSAYCTTNAHKHNFQTVITISVINGCLGKVGQLRTLFTYNVSTLQLSGMLRRSLFVYITARDSAIHEILTLSASLARVTQLFTLSQTQTHLRSRSGNAADTWNRHRNAIDRRHE